MDYIGRALVADALAEWRKQLQALAVSSPLRDLNGSDAPTLNLAGSHPSGLAQLFAERPTLMSTMVREPAALAEALRLGREMREHSEHVQLNSGVSTAALVVGVATWTDDDGRREVPLLLRPVTLSVARDTDTEIRLLDAAFVNPVFAAELRARGVTETLDALADASLRGKEFDPRPLWNRVREMTAVFGEDLTVEESLVLGSFDDPEQRLEDDLDECDHLIGSSLLLASVAGDAGAHRELATPVPIVGAADRDPFAERGLGDLDDVQFAALDLVATGRSLFVQVPPGGDAIGTAAAIAADGAASGKCVAVVAGGTRTLSAVAGALDAAEAGELYISGADPGWNSAARKDLLASMTATAPGVDEAALRRDGERLLAARAQMRSRMEDLHLIWEPWGVSAYQCVQALVRLTSVEHPPVTQVRLGGEPAATVAERGLAVVAEAGMRAYAARLGVPLPGEEPEPAEPEEPEEEAPPPPPWWASVVHDPELGPRLDDALERFLGVHLPRLRQDAETVSAEVAVDGAFSLSALADQLELFERLRHTLDTFQPAVFTHHHGDVVAATAPEGSPMYGDMPKRERKAIEKRARELLRPNRPYTHLHELLVEAGQLNTRWRQHCSVGAIPAVPDSLDAVAARFAESAAVWAEIAPAAEAATGIARLADQPWDVLTDALGGLAGGAEAAVAEADVQEAERRMEESGFGPLLDDLEARAVPLERSAAEFEFSWWAAAFDSIAAQAPSLTTYGALGGAVTAFLEHDAAFAAGRVGPLLRAVGERRRVAIARQQDDARDLFSALVEGGDSPVRELWGRFPNLVGALRPVVLAAADQVSHIAPAQRVFDTVVLVGVESLAFAEVVPALARASQVIVLADAHSATNSAVAMLRETLPPLALHARPEPRDPRVTAVLDDHGYAGELEMFPAPDGGTLDVVAVDAVATPAPGARHADTSRAEVAAVIERLSRAAMAGSARRTAVIAGNPAHAAAIRAALDERGTSSIQRVPVATLGTASTVEAELVILSLGWAPTASGEIPDRLGALSQSRGARALRQAIVASSRDVVLVTALTQEHIAAAATHADLGHGLDMLADLVAVAEAGPLEPATDEKSDWLLTDVANRLREHGLKVGVRFGVGRSVIPLVVAADERSAVLRGRGDRQRAAARGSEPA